MAVEIKDDPEVIVKNLTKFLKILSEVEKLSFQEQKHFWNEFNLALKELPRDQRNEFRDGLGILIRELFSEEVS